MALTKAGIITKVTQETGRTKHQCIQAVECVLEILKDTLASGGDVLISGFGKCCVCDKAERRGRNPATGKDLILAPRKVVTFKSSGRLKEKLNPKPVTKAKKRRVRA